MIKRIALSVLSFISGVVITTLSNMGIVMLLFYPSTNYSILTASIIIILLASVEGIMGGIITAVIPRPPTYYHLIAVITFMSLMLVISIVLNVSLEPLWYKVFHFSIATTMFFLSGKITINKRRAGAAYKMV